MNKVTLIGNVGDTPEIRTAGSGTRIAKVSLATNRKWKDKDGNKREETEWHKLTFFGGVVDVVERYVDKGDKIAVEGRLHYSATEHEGVKKYWTEIIVNDLHLLGGGGVRQTAGATSSPHPSSPSFSGDDDDLPF